MCVCITLCTSVHVCVCMFEKTQTGSWDCSGCVFWLCQADHYYGVEGQVVWPEGPDIFVRLNEACRLDEWPLWEVEVHFLRSQSVLWDSRDTSCMSEWWAGDETGHPGRSQVLYLVHPEIKNPWATLTCVKETTSSCRNSADMHLKNTYPRCSFSPQPGSYYWLWKHIWQSFLHDKYINTLHKITILKYKHL